MTQRIFWHELIDNKKLWLKFVHAMQNGSLCAMATDTLYGLMVDGDNRTAVQRLYKLKGRNPTKPLILFLSDFESLAKIGVHCLPDIRKLLLNAWPGPLTAVFPKPPKVISAFNHQTIGIRVPDHKNLQDCLSKYPGHLLSTSANISNQPPLKTLDEIEAEFGKHLDWLIETSDTPSGSPSTVIDATSWPPHILRQGVCKIPEGNYYAR